MQKMSTCLWFDGQAEEAARFYVSVFRNSKVKQTVLYGGPKFKLDIAAMRKAAA